MAAMTVAGQWPGAAAQTVGPDVFNSAAALPSATGNAAAGTAFSVGSAANAAGSGRGGGNGRLPFTIVPTLAVTQTFTHGDSVTPGDSRFESVTQLSPGVQISSGSGRIRGFLNYAVNALRYANESGRSGIQQTLNTAVQAEVVEKYAFVDANANISLQPISALGPQYSNDTLSRSNRTEVRSYALSPYVRGAIAGRVDYEARLSHASTHTVASTGSDSQSTSGSLRFSGRTVLSAVDWSLFGTRESLDYDLGRRTQSDRVSAELGYAVLSQLRLSVRGGRESSNLLTADKQGTTTHGYGFAWHPSEVTSLSAQQDRRVYGNTHSVIFSHRTARTIWTYTDTRDVSTGATRSALGSLGSAYELLFQLFASQQPDPALRATLVNAYLQNNGINPNAQVLSDFLTSAASSQRYQALSVAWLGLRDTATLTASQGNSRRIDRLASVVDDLSQADAIRQQGAALNLAHRLTPLSSVSLSGSLLRTSAAGLATSRLASLDAGWTAQLGVRTSATVSARRSVYRGGTSSYTETALTGGLALRF